MKKTLISTAYIYPVCPLSFNHARMFVIADVFARYARSMGDEVFFPIATHYSGNTAHKISDQISRDMSPKNPIYLQYKNYYKLTTNIIKSFSDPMNILDYFNHETLWELKSLNISADFNYQYTTGHEDFSAFVDTIIDRYKTSGLLVKNSKGELGLCYEDSIWKSKTINLIESSEFIHYNQKNQILSSVDNIKSDWGLLRDDGFGAIYDSHIVDPMFDSEIFSIFDLYIKNKQKFQNDCISPSIFFDGLFDVLSGSRHANNKLEKEIIRWLPCNIFVCEEHLKNWVAKKMYTESLLFNKRFQTTSYIILGMGFLNKKHMSASRGNSIMTKDLIEDIGSLKTRLLILMQGGQLSKVFNYDGKIIEQINIMINRFNSYFIFLKLIVDNNNFSIANHDVDLAKIESDIKFNIKYGYFRETVITLLDIIPKQYLDISPKDAKGLIDLYKKYLSILAPNMLEGY